MELTVAAPQLTSIAYFLNTTFASFDLAIAKAVHLLYVILPWLFTPLLSFVTLLASPAGSICIALFFTLWKRTRRYGIAMLLAIAVGALMTNVLIKPLVLRPRPYSWEGSVYQEYWRLLGEHKESDYSFPSGHTTAAFAMAYAVLTRGDRSKTWKVYILSGLIAISRIYLSVHYATDVLVGMIVGTLGGIGGCYLVKFIPEKFYELDLPLPGGIRLSGGSEGKHLRK